MAEQFERIFDAGEREWILEEFVRPLPVGDAVYDFTRAEVLRLAVKFGRSLKLNEQLYDFIRQTRAGAEALARLRFRAIHRRSRHPSPPPASSSSTCTG